MFSLRSPLSCCQRILDQINPAAHRPISPAPFSMEALDPELEMLGRPQIPLTSRRHPLVEFFLASRKIDSTVGSTLR